MPKRLVKNEDPGVVFNKRTKKNREENANLKGDPLRERVFIKSSPKDIHSDMEDVNEIDNVTRIMKNEPASTDEVDNVVKTIKKEHTPSDEEILPDEVQSDIEVVDEIENIAKIVKNEPFWSDENDSMNNLDTNEYTQSNGDLLCERQCAGYQLMLYKTTKQQKREQLLNHLRYVKTLVHQLTGDCRQPRDRASTSTSDSEDIRLNGKLHNILTGVRKDCKVCSQRNKAGKRRQTTYYCNTCPDKPGMHLGNCFMKYHTQQNYKD